MSIEERLRLAQEKKEGQRASKRGDLRPRMGTSVNSVIEPS
jgi:hypothetical protein